ncbi:hypothetical protein HDE_09532 [Halotydeus destructor]|nr:hypothetical protein HDE_09532 [Halotydeus destructor]
MFKLADQLSSSLGPTICKKLSALDTKMESIVVIASGFLMCLKLIATFFVPMVDFWRLVTNFPNTEYDYIFDTALFLPIWYCALLMCTYMQLYTHFSAVLAYHCQLMSSLCKGILEDESKRHRRSYQYIMKLYSDHIEAKERMNELMSLTPFCSAAALFMTDLTGVSFIIVTGSKISKTLLFGGIVPSMAFVHLWGLRLCLAAGGATYRLKRAAKSILLVTSHEKPKETRAEKQTRKLLHRMVSTLDPEPARSYSLFSIDSSMALTFASQVLPFVVTVITAMSSTTIE